MDCFDVGRLSRLEGFVWQYTAIDVASAHVWAFLRFEERNPSVRRTAELVHTVARDLAAAGWRLREITTDNGSEFRSRDFGRAAEARGDSSRPAAELERLRRARPADDPRGVLAAGLLALARPEDHGAKARPR